jgi:multiple sugar transport system substrate-binding protein
MSKTMSRRDFLKAATGAAGAAALSAAGVTAASSALKSAAAPAAQSGPLTVLFHSSTGTGAYWDPRLDLFREQHPDVEYIPLASADDSEFVQKVSTMVAGGTPPDMAKLSGGRMLATAPTGIYEDLTPRVEDSAFMSSIWEQMPGQGKELTYCGQQIAVPQDLAFRMWFYNKDVFDAAGVAYPSLEFTWDDVIEMGTAITNHTENIWFIQPPIHTFEATSEWYWQAGGTLFSSDCMHANLIEEPNLVAMRYLVSLFKEHQIAPPPSLGLGDIGIDFASGRMAMTQGASGELAAQLGPRATWTFNWGSLFVPTGPATGHGFVKSNGWALLKDAPAADLGWQFIEWWHSDETATTFAEWGELVPRADLRDTVSLQNIPEEHHPAIARAGTHGRGLERCPGWSAAQKHWMQELETAINGNVPVDEAMATAYAKADAEIADIMANACPA